MERILNIFKESLFKNVNGSDDDNWKTTKNSMAYNDSYTPVIHPDATNATLGTLLCGAMSAISLLVYYFCN
ncbi:MAG: hypothetical protein ACUZ8H_15920 [Candidatus Anammoxibacter sp.]